MAAIQTRDISRIMTTPESRRQYKGSTSSRRPVTMDDGAFRGSRYIQGTESRVATFLAETCVMSHQSLSRQAKSKYESPTAVEFGSRTPKSDHGSSENV
ncbi:hypothetical protein LSH36_196g06031 [Paralvinella palmiformis]|uniref:Uncharacterized protein n=1 Tax=Paralvinella palmiformis TaxID=53620 RepID=A0AAD9JQQ3_9ANNE|nr:hypothetical protein LSH36_196g06031 [Paralvinella palmiformis]